MMTGHRGRERRFATGFALILALAGNSFALADDDGASGGTQPVTTRTGTSTLPDSLVSPGTNTNLGNQFGGCAQNLQTQLQTLFAAVGRGADGTRVNPATALATPKAGGIAPACERIDPDKIAEVPESCSAIVSVVSGKLSAAGYERLKKTFAAYQAQANCAEKQIAAVQDNIACLNKQLEQTQMALNAAKGGLTQYRIQALMAVNEVNGMVREVRAQKEELLNYLLGDRSEGSSGKIGMRDALKNANDLSVKMKDQIHGMGGEPGIKARYDMLATQTRRMDEYMPILRAAEARKCIMGETRASFVCHVGDQATSFPDYMTCVLEETIKARSARDGNPNGASSSVKADAAVKAKNMRGILERMFAAMPESTLLPDFNNPGALQEAGDKSYAVVDEKQTEKFVNELRAFDAYGLNVSKRVEDMISSCYRRAEQSIKDQETRQRGRIGELRKGMSSMRADIKKDADKLLSFYDTQYKLMCNSMNLQCEGIDLKTCQASSATSKQQIDCLTSQETAHNDFLKNSPQTFVLKPSDAGIIQRHPELALKLTCRGLEGCVGALEAAHANRKTVERDLNSQRVNFINARNKEMDQSLSQTAQSFSASMNMFAQHINSLNAILSEMGGDKIEYETYDECKSHEYDEAPDMEPKQELMREPSDYLAAIGCRTTPPSIRFDGKALGSAASALKPAVEKLNSLRSTLKSRIDALESKRSECIAEFRSKLEETVNGWTAGSCWGTGACAKRGAVSAADASWKAIMDAMGGIKDGGAGQTDSDVRTSSAADVPLSSGLSGAYCEPPSETAEPNGACKFKDTGSRASFVFDEAELKKLFEAEYSSCIDPPADKKPDCDRNRAEHRRSLESQCNESKKAIADIIRNNQAGCGKEFGGAVGKAKAVNLIDSGANNESSQSGDE